MISPLMEDARERYGYIYAKEKIFLISPNFQGAFSRKIGQKGAFLRWVSDWDVWGDATRPTTFSLFSIL